jgi:hypothetical protein
MKLEIRNFSAFSQVTFLGIIKLSLNLFKSKLKTVVYDKKLEITFNFLVRLGRIIFNFLGFAGLG